MTAIFKRKSNIFFDRYLQYGISAPIIIITILVTKKSYENSQSFIQTSCSFRENFVILLLEIVESWKSLKVNSV